MEILFIALCIITALLMVVLLEIEVDIKHGRSILVILHINILAIELRNKKKGRGADKKSAAPVSLKVRKSAAYLKFITKLIEGADVTVNKLNLPDVLPDDYRIEYIKDAAYSGIISLFLAYLTSKTLKLNESDDAYNGTENAFIFDVTLKTQILHVMKTYFVMRGRFAAIRAEEKG